MARTFTKNTANYCSLGNNVLSPLLNGVGAVSMAAWVKPASFTAGTNFNRILNIAVNAGTSGLVLMVSGASAKVEMGARSQAADAFGKATGATTVSTGSWVHVAGTVNFASPNITVYLNGTSDGTATPTFGSATYAPGTPTIPDMIGCFASSLPPTDTSYQWDGEIAELGLWDVVLTASEASALAKGVPPTRIRSTRLCAYWAIHGDPSSILNRVGSTAAGAVTGSLPVAAHAPVAPWFGCSSDWVPYATSAPASVYFPYPLFLRRAV